MMCDISCDPFKLSPQKFKSERLVQRYKGQQRLVVGTVPFIRQRGGADSQPLKIVLVNSNNYPEEWLLPKGGWENNETAEDGAARETWEESGCHGSITSTLITDYAVCGGKERQLHSYFAMEISALAVEWPEQAKRSRKLCDLAEAACIISSQSRRKDREAQLAALTALQQSCVRPPKLSIK